MINPPTDNLYKFFAVLGIIIIASSSSLWLKIESTIDSHVEEFIKNTEEFRVQTDEYIEKINEIKTFIRKNGGLEGVSEETKEKYLKMLSDTDPLEESVNNLSRRAEGPIVILKRQVEQYETKKVISISGIVIGLIMFLGGTYLWHKRLQTKLDAKFTK